MSDCLPPSWLSDFQREFGSIVSRPLSVEGGTFRSQRSSLKSLTHKVFGDYNQQYWFRLFTVMQKEYPLTAELLGYWNFNRLVQEYLQWNPPRSYDVQKIAPMFPEFITRQYSELKESIKSSLPWPALAQAAAIDSAFQEVFLAPPSTPWLLTPALAPSLPAQELCAAPSWCIVRQDWQLIEARAALLQQPHAPISSPPRSLEGSEDWLIFRSDSRVGQVRLQPLQALLYNLLSKESVGSALARIEAACPPTGLAGLPDLVQQWLRQSIQWELWSI